jgi:hypothetical protein
MVEPAHERGQEQAGASGLDSEAEGPASSSASDLRRALSPVLHSHGYGAVCAPDDPRPARLDLATWGGFLLAVYLLGVTTWNVAALTGIPLWLRFVITFLALVGMFALGATEKAGAVVFVVAFLSVVARSVLDGFYDAAALAGGFGLAALASYYLPRVAVGLRRLELLGLVRSVPLIIPVTLLFVFVPLFTAELWRTASSLDVWRFLAFSGLLILPPLALLARQSLAGLHEAFVEEAAHLELDPDAANRAASKMRGSAPVATEQGQFVVERGFEAPFPSAEVGGLVVTLRLTLRRQLLLRLVPTLMGVGLTVFVYIYLLALSLIPTARATEWVGIAPAKVSLLSVQLPLLDAYLAVAGVLGVFATAAFAALVLTEQHFSDTLTDALLRAPAQELLLLALPYRAALRDSQGPDDRSS